MKRPSNLLRAPALLAALVAFATATARADEGMWTFDHVPTADIQARYGVALTPGWLDHVRLSSLRMAAGCSASLVSAQGLVMTNHHCARSCIQDLSGLAKRNYNEDGFYARRTEDEVRCPGMEFDQLLAIEDVTDRILEATRGLAGDAFEPAQRKAFATLEARCATSSDRRCEVVTLFRGGRYALYTYRRLQDARLVFAPEDAIASFGGDPDNFNFPRFDLDVTFLRLYGADGKPLAVDQHLAWSDGKLAAGDPTFVVGNPGRTSRELTIAQLGDLRDHVLPKSMVRVGELRGFLTEYQARGDEQKRHSNQALFGTENYLKVLIGEQAALVDPAFFGKLMSDEKTLRERIQADPALRARYGDLWDRLAGSIEVEQRYRVRREALEGGGYGQGLFETARGLLRAGDESAKPNGERLREYSDARLPRLREQLLAARPIDREFETAMFERRLIRLRDDLGADDPLVRSIFGPRSPAALAKAIVGGTRLAEGGRSGTDYRRQLLEGGKAAVDAAQDPMIEFARALDPAARAIRLTWEVEVEGPQRQQQERLAQARFAVYGDRQAPDATFTLRLSYGAVRGWRENGRDIPPFTTVAGAYAHATGGEPYALPPTWLAARARLDPALPFNVVTTNDIIGGNSGSPMVDRNGAVVGLIFDGNLPSLGGDFGHDDATHRAVAVHSEMLLEALRKVYRADRIADEIRPVAPR